jgi:hypothetical protein
METPLRIYADFNSGGLRGEGPCWNLRYGGDNKLLDELASELRLIDGMQVILYYEDPSEEFVVRASLIAPSDEHGRWQALPDWDTFRRLRG